MSKNYVVKKLNNPNLNHVIAEIVDKNTKKQIGLVVYDKMLRHRTGSQAQGKHYKNAENESVIVITINDNFKRLFDSQPNLFEGVVMHEVGHLINGDFTRSRTETDERGNAILNNEVDLKEVKADMFAVNEIGKNRFIKYLEWAINNRRDLEYDNPEYKQMAIKEYENRIRILKNGIGG